MVCKLNNIFVFSDFVYELLNKIHDLSFMIGIEFTNNLVFSRDVEENVFNRLMVWTSKSLILDSGSLGSGVEKLLGENLSCLLLLSREMLIGFVAWFYCSKSTIKLKIMKIIISCPPMLKIEVHMG